MGKLKAKARQQAVRAQAHPYARPDELSEASAMATEADVGASATAAGTRGAILQRHKRELKELRSELEKMRGDRLKLSKKKHDSKAERKKLTQEMKAKEDALVARQKAELAEWDQAQQGNAEARPLKKNGYPAGRRRRNRGKGEAVAGGEEGQAPNGGEEAPANGATPAAPAPAPAAFAFSLRPAQAVALDPAFGGGMDTS